MALKYQLDSIDDLDDGLKSFYTEQDGKFVLGIEGLPPQEDVTGLKNKVETLLNEKKEANRKAKEAEDAANKAAEEAARKSGDMEALEASWRSKMDKALVDKEAELENKNAAINKMMVDNVAISLANEISLKGSASVLLPHIKQRLKAEQRNGELATAVLDEHGRPTALTVDDLKQEFSNNPAFAPLIVGSRASGGGANGQQGGGGAVTKKFNEMSGGELKQLREQNPAQYERLRAEHHGN